MDGLEEDYAGKLAVEQINADTDEGKAVMEAYGLRGHPGYAIVTPKGDVKWTATGQLDAAALQSQVERELR